MPKIRTTNTVKGLKMEPKDIAYGKCPSCRRATLVPKRSPSGQRYGECPVCRRTFRGTVLN